MIANIIPAIGRVSIYLGVSRLIFHDQIMTVPAFFSP
jgi:hypothetical protein